MTDAYTLLSQPVRRYIRDKRWESFRPIQAAAIERILTTDCNYILASRTASGKTEAAFLPVLSKVDFVEPGVQVLYISPLIALINDQMQRIEDLCRYLDVTITKWHGEASVSAKNKLIKNPGGIVLITPESLEAMFANKPFNVNALFSNLKFVIIDEIHYFIGTDRGIQLKSLLHRLQSRQKTPFRFIGLSATIGDYNEAKAFTGNVANTKVLLDATVKPMHTQFRFYREAKLKELPLELLKQLYVDTRDKKTLIFPNSRGRVEEVAVKLKKISDYVGGYGRYFSHHSAIDKDRREYIEFFAKNNNQLPFAISCTSTLELGIDIGAVDTVVQIDSTFNVSSLIQRVGRSGRADDACSNLLLYATNKWALLQSLACWNLHKKGIIEPAEVTGKPYDLMVHQLLSITKECSGIALEQLLYKIHENCAFTHISFAECKDIIGHLLRSEILEYVQNEVIIGIEGEKIVNGREFYSAFIPENNFKVYHNTTPIGELSDTTQIAIDSNIFLSAKIWKIIDIDWKTRKIFVAKANDGKKPMYSNEGGNIPDVVLKEMYDILFSKEQFDILDEPAKEELEQMRTDFSRFDKVTGLENHIACYEDDKVLFFPFVGSRKLRTLYFMIKSMGFSVTLTAYAINIKCTAYEFGDIINRLSANSKYDLDPYLLQMLDEGVLTCRSCSKWGYLLPQAYQLKILKQKMFDLE